MIVTFDRGNGKIGFVCQIVFSRFKVSTFTAAMGSLHPFILKYLREDSFQAKGSTEIQIHNLLNSVKDWVLYEENCLGPEVFRETTSIKCFKKVAR